MEFVVVSVSENGQNGLGDEGADEAMPPIIFGLNSPCNSAEIAEPMTRLQLWQVMPVVSRRPHPQNFTPRP